MQYNAQNMGVGKRLVQSYRCSSRIRIFISFIFNFFKEISVVIRASEHVINAVESMIESGVL